MQLTLLTPSTDPVVTLDEARAHLRVDFADDDTTIQGYTAAAVSLCEAYLSRSFCSTSWRLTEDCFPGMYLDPRRPSWLYERDTPGQLLAQYFPRARVLSVDSVTYTATDGTATTLDPSLYTVQLGDEARLAPVYGRTWPATRYEPGAFRVDFTAGYGPTAADVPAVIKTAVKVLLTHLYANRGDAPAELPQLVKLLLSAEGWGAYG